MTRLLGGGEGECALSRARFDRAIEGRESARPYASSSLLEKVSGVCSAGMTWLLKNVFRKMLIPTDSTEFHGSGIDSGTRILEGDLGIDEGEEGTKRSVVAGWRYVKGVRGM